MRLDMSGLPLAKITYSLSRRMSVISSPAGVEVRPRSSQGCMR